MEIQNNQNNQTQENEVKRMTLRIKDKIKEKQIKTTANIVRYIPVPEDLSISSSTPSRYMQDIQEVISPDVFDEIFEDMKTKFHEASKVYYAIFGNNEGKLHYHNFLSITRNEDLSFSENHNDVTITIDNGHFLALPYKDVRDKDGGRPTIYIYDELLQIYKKSLKDVEIDETNFDKEHEMVEEIYSKIITFNRTYSVSDPNYIKGLDLLYKEIKKTLKSLKSLNAKKELEIEIQRLNFNISEAATRKNYVSNYISVHKEDESISDKLRESVKLLEPDINALLSNLKENPNDASSFLALQNASEATKVLANVLATQYYNQNIEQYQKPERKFENINDDNVFDYIDELTSTSDVVKDNEDDIIIDDLSIDKIRDILSLKRAIENSNNIDSQQKNKHNSFLLECLQSNYNCGSLSYEELSEIVKKEKNKNIINLENKIFQEVQQFIKTSSKKSFKLINKGLITSALKDDRVNFSDKLSELQSEIRDLDFQNYVKNHSIRETVQKYSEVQIAESLFKSNEIKEELKRRFLNQEKTLNMRKIAAKAEGFKKINLSINKPVMRRLNGNVTLNGDVTKDESENIRDFDVDLSQKKKEVSPVWLWEIPISGNMSNILMLETVNGNLNELRIAHTFPCITANDEAGKLTKFIFMADKKKYNQYGGNVLLTEYNINNFGVQYQIKIIPSEVFSPDLDTNYNNKNIEHVRETENDDIHKNNEHENKPGLVSMLSDYDKENIGDEIKNENTK